MNNEKLLKPVQKDQPIMIDVIDGPYAHSDVLRKYYYQRGL